MDSVGIIGIGAMGNGIAKNLIKAGYPLVAYRRNTDSSIAAAGELEALGAKVTDKLSELFEAVDVLILCVPDSQIVEELLTGKDGLSNCPSSSVRSVLDFSTSHPDSTKKLALLLKKRGIDMLDTPMTGSVREAAEGTIKLIVGGEKAVFERHEKLLNSVASMVLFAGGHGSGNLVKLANNYLAVLDQTVTAGISIVLERNGVPSDVYVKFLGSSSANSGGFKLMMNRIATGDFSKKFGLGLALKDIGYCKDVFDLPITETLYAILKEASDAGFRDKDVGTVYSFLKGKM